MNYAIEDRKLSFQVGEDILSTNVESLAKQFRDRIDEAAGDANQIELNLSGVETIDSQGLNLLIGLFQECKKKKWGFRVTHCTENVRWLFSIFKLTEVFGVTQNG